MAAGAREINLRCWDQEKLALSQEHAYLWSPSSLITVELFGEDLSQQDQDLLEMNYVEAQLRGRKGGEEPEQGEATVGLF